MPKKLLTKKQEKFCLEYFKTGSGSQAIIVAGYHTKNPDVLSAENLTKPSIIARIQALRKKAEDATIMDVVERKQRLTGIARATIPDFQDEGGGIVVKKGIPLAGAVSEVTTKNSYNRKSMTPVVITNLKLHSPTQAIDLLNKMDKIYSEAPPGSVTNNTQINIFVQDGETKDLLAKVGERTGKLIDGVSSGL